MSRNPHLGPAPLRGCVVGAATGALAVAAHGAAGGGYPTSAGTALLLLTTLLTGWVSGSAGTGSIPRSPSLGTGILLPLVSGQFVGHWALTGLAGHHAETSTAAGESLSAAMLTAHLLAVLLCSLAIAVAERLYRAASAVVRALVAPLRGPRPTPRFRAATHLTASRQHPPNGASGPRAPPARVRTDLPPSFGEKVFRPCPTGFPRPCAAV